QPGASTENSFPGRATHGRELLGRSRTLTTPVRDLKCRILDRAPDASKSSCTSWLALPSDWKTTTPNQSPESPFAEGGAPLAGAEPASASASVIESRTPFGSVS